MQNREHEQGADSVIPATLAAMMDVDLVVNEKSHVWILHEKPFPHILEWVEYDPEMNSLTLVGEDGSVLDLGMVIPDAVRDLLMRGSQVYGVQLGEDDVEDIAIVPLMVMNGPAY